MAEKLLRRFSFGAESLFRPSKKRKNVASRRSSTEDDISLATPVTPGQHQQKAKKEDGHTKKECTDDDDEHFHDNLYAELRARCSAFSAPLTPIVGDSVLTAGSIRQRKSVRHAGVGQGGLINSRLVLSLSESTDYLQRVRRRGGISKDQLPRDVHGFHDRLIMVQEEKAMAAVPQFPIEVQRFISYVQERKKKRILFKGELLMIKKAFEAHKMDCATSKEFEQKNNYPDVLPFDYNRVVLETLPSLPHSHYMNASYVDFTSNGIVRELAGSKGHYLPVLANASAEGFIWEREIDFYNFSFYHLKAYVVTQSVKSKTACVDFWRMIWELNSNCIVMLTKVFDFMKVMCLQYWPLGKFYFGDIAVETLETKHYAYFVIRTLRIAKGTEEARIVKQFHFTEWEANSLPYTSALLDFRRRIRKHTVACPSEGPMVVHCSNGGERSGVFLAIDANLELLQEEHFVDVYGYCKILINARQNLVDSLDQYMFIYDALSEAVQCNMEPFPLNELKQRSTMYMTKKSRQTMESQHLEEYKLLCHLTPSLRIGDCAGGHRLENRGKNRDVMVVPPDYARPYLSTLHGESKDYTYINAVHVDGFTRKNEWIVSEWPKNHTIDSFWALIFDHSCHTVVNLSSNQKNNKSYPTFIHNKGRQVYGPFIVEVLNHHSYPYMTSHMVKVMKRKAMDIAREQEEQRRAEQEKSKDPSNPTEQKSSTFMLTEIMASSKNSSSETEYKICNIISVKMWPIQHKVPLSTSGLIDVVKMVRSWRKRAPDRPETKPTVVISHTGVSRCGIFVAANIIIDQMDLDQECDVFHACKMVRLNRPQLIDNKEEYKYLYDFVLHYYITSPDYKTEGEKNGPVALDMMDSNHIQFK